MAIELRHMRYVIAVAETGQLTRASARLHIAQPALSQSILRIEEEIGTTLFERHPRGVTPTPAGLAFLEHARAAVASSDAAIASARQTVRTTGDQLLLGFMNGLLTPAQPLLSAFAAAHEDIALVLRELTFASQIDSLLDGTVDAAVLCPGPPLPEFESIPIGRASLCVYVSENHHLASRNELHFADIADETFVGPGPGIPDWWVDIWWLTSQRGAPARTGRHTASTTNESLAAVLSGEVIVVAPAFFVLDTPIPEVSAIPLVNVDAANIELVHLRNHPTRAATRLAWVARTLQPQAA